MYGDFEEYGKLYNTKSYTVEEGILKDTYVVERYNSSFKESEYNLINQTIIKCESREKCASALDKIETEVRIDYPEISGFIIVDDSYVGGKTITYPGTDYLAFILVFRIADLLVLLSGVTPSEVNFLTYGHIIENSINKFLECYNTVCGCLSFKMIYTYFKSIS